MKRWQIIGQLLDLARPLGHVMAGAIVLGIAGHLSAMAIPVLGGYTVLNFLGRVNLSYGSLFKWLLGLAVLRGFFRYGEQLMGHYIAFKLLALIRDKVFTVLRRLAPSETEMREKGNLMTLITTDIELLEVFYAHTISPVVIAVVTSLVVLGYVGHFHWGFALILGIGYVVVGGVIPRLILRLGEQRGKVYRAATGQLSSYLLESIRGVKEVLQYQQTKQRQIAIANQTKDLEAKQKVFKHYESLSAGLSELVILLCGISLMGFGLWLQGRSKIDVEGVILPLVAGLSSFGPVLALSALSNNLLQTLASGERVLGLLNKEPRVREVTEGKKATVGSLRAEDVSFCYKPSLIVNSLEGKSVSQVFDKLSLDIPRRGIIGIKGKSGCGKSTLIRLFMRFWQVDTGQIRLDNQSIEELTTDSLRDLESYMTQETILFNTTIEDNISLGNPNYSRDQVILAAKAAAIDELISGLPEGYQTVVGELGNRLSDGEKQRIGLARVFLYNRPIVFFDEPTSNLDSLNEGMILKAIDNQRQNKLIVLVSHRQSTLNLCDQIIRLD